MPADTVLLNQATSTGAIIATDQATDGSSQHYQIVKLAWGPLDTFNISASTLAFPVTVTNNPSTIFTLANPTTAVSALITNTSSTAIWVRSTAVTISNPTTAVSISNPTTAVSVDNPTTAVSAAITSQSATALSVQALDPLDKVLLATGSSYAPQYASIAVSSSGNNTIVTNTAAGIKVTVLAMSVVSKTGADLYMQDGASTVLFGSSNAMIGVSSQGGFVLPYNPKGWFRTGSSANLILHNSLGSTIAGSLTYALSS